MDEKIYAKYCPKCGDVAFYGEKTQCEICEHELKVTPPEYDLYENIEYIFSDEYREKKTTLY
ncbi:MAG: hypothetical protein LIO87_06810 [Eubacterium sp.]|nr:hypothetical protein [Eubacterium sp.]MCC8161223.1 hypothetical protein [Oscillospiraceae bacterium]